MNRPFRSIISASGHGVESQPGASWLRQSSLGVSGMDSLSLDLDLFSRKTLKPPLRLDYCNRFMLAEDKQSRKTS